LKYKAALRPLEPREKRWVLSKVKKGWKYREIIQAFPGQFRNAIKSCHIAKVKRESEIGTRRAWNSGKTYHLK